VGRRLIVGLGNPGPRYARTRHNVGFDVARRVVASLGALPLVNRDDACAAWLAAPDPADPGGHGLAVVTPLRFMNRSGEALAEFRRSFDFAPADCLVVVDDVYLPLGRIRLRAGGSPGGHNGLASVTAAFGNGEFPRLRIGVGGAATAAQLAEHVLSGFDDDEQEALSEVLDRSTEAALLWASEGITAAMNRYNVPARDARDEQTPQGER
jgi:PTH1 family peptidyl-tRNA hydrolase